MTNQNRKFPATSYRLPGDTLKQITELTEILGMTKTGVLSRAIDRLYQEAKMLTVTDKQDMILARDLTRTAETNDTTPEDFCESESDLNDLKNGLDLLTRWTCHRFATHTSTAAAQSEADTLIGKGYQVQLEQTFDGGIQVYGFKRRT